MNHDLYIFGSAVRGEVSATSDIDVLVVPFSGAADSYPNSWSVYSAEIIRSYYQAGRLFAWHLHLESKCIFSANEMPFLSSLGSPEKYTSGAQDIEDLRELLLQALNEIGAGSNSLIYELGIAYTAIRDIAMVASWSLMDGPCFSRKAPYLIPVRCPLPENIYQAAMLARHVSTRGVETDTNFEAASEALLDAPLIDWIDKIRSKL